MRTNRLLTKQLLFKIVELYVHEHRESLWHLLSVWREPGQWFFSQYCIHHRMLQN